MFSITTQDELEDLSPQEQVRLQQKEAEYLRDIAKMKMQTEKNKISSKNSKIITGGGDASFEQMKHEYIEVVRKGRENEHMMYILSGTSSLSFLY